MNQLLLPLGRIAGLTGFFLSLASGLARLLGMHWFAGFETVTILQAGLSGMVLGCFCLLLFITGDAGKGPAGG